MKKKAPAAKKAAPSKPSRRTAPSPPAPDAAGLFDRVALILDQARAGVARAVNSGMVLAYWLIGREIVQELQSGDERAAYGKRIVRDLSDRLSARYGEGFGPLNLWLFRRFYLVFSDRTTALPGPAETRPAASTKVYPAGKLSAAARNRTPALSAIVYPAGKESGSSKSRPALDESDGPPKLSLMGREVPPPFHPNLSWSHYRALLSVEKPVAREFYESECAAAGWTKRNAFRFSLPMTGAMPPCCEPRSGSPMNSRGWSETEPPGCSRKRPQPRRGCPIIRRRRPGTGLRLWGREDSGWFPSMRSFLANPRLLMGKRLRGLKTGAAMTDLEAAKITKLKDIVTQREDRGHQPAADPAEILESSTVLEFLGLPHNPRLHESALEQAIMDNLNNTNHKVPGHIPTIGLILCSGKNETIARYSVLHENRQLFASKYQFHLPSEEELAAELKPEILRIGEGEV